MNNLVWQPTGKRKIFVGVPSRQPVTTAWVNSFFRLIEATREKYEVVFNFSSEISIEVARIELVQNALKENCDFIFFLDSDVLCPPETISKLLADLNLSKKMIASGVYFTDTPLNDPGAFMIPDDFPKNYFIPIEMKDEGGINVDWVGLGCCLIDSRIFRYLNPPWFRHLWFFDETRPENGAYCGEDSYFFTRLWKEFPDRRPWVYLDFEILCEHEKMRHLTKEDYLIKKEKMQKNFEFCPDKAAKHPRVFQIETHNYCNSHCIFCPVSTMKRKRGFMSDELFKKVIDDIGENIPEVVRILPFLSGEPFLDKKLLEKVAYINKKVPKAKVVIFSNGTLFTEELVKEMHKVRIDGINISINANSKESYEKIMGMDFDKTIASIEILMRNKPRWTEVVASFITDFVDDKEIEGIKSRWKELGANSLISSPYKNWAGNENVVQGKLEKTDEPCWRLYDQMFVLWDGRVSLCCMDAEGEVIFGDLNKSSIMEVWNSHEYVFYREMNASGQRQKLKLCNKCSRA